MFDKHCELILCLLTRPKCDLDEVEKVIIQVVECHFEVIFCFLTNLKYDFFQVVKAAIQVVEWLFQSHFLPLDKPKMPIV